MIATEVTQKVQLVEGKFNPSEASDIIDGLIKEKINFHKMQRLKMMVGDELCNTNYLNGRVEELVNEKMIAKDFISEARKKGLNVRISGTLEISFEDQ